MTLLTLPLNFQTKSKSPRIETKKQAPYGTCEMLRFYLPVENLSSTKRTPSSNREVEESALSHAS